MTITDFVDRKILILRILLALDSNRLLFDVKNVFTTLINRIVHFVIVVLSYKLGQQNKKQ